MVDRAEPSTQPLTPAAADAVSAPEQLRPPLMSRLLYYGVPSGLQMLLEVLGFTAFVFLVGRLGVNELAATNLAFNVSSLAFMPVFGLAMTASILVGQQLGGGRADLAARATWTTMWIAVAYIGAISVLYVAVPDVFLFTPIFFEATHIGFSASVAPSSFSAAALRG